MNDYPGGLSSRRSERRLNRLQFRSITYTHDAPQEQIMYRVSTPLLNREKQRGVFLIAPKILLQQREPSPVNHNQLHDVTKPSQVEAQPVQKVNAPLSLPAHPKPGEQFSPLLKVNHRQREKVRTDPLRPRQSGEFSPMPKVNREQSEDVQTDPLMPSVQTDTLPMPSRLLLEKQETVRLEVTTPPALEGVVFATDDPEIDKRATFPMMVLTDIASRQGEPTPTMKSEVSGAAGAAGIVGFGNILGSILKYVSSFLIQYGFGPAGFGLYTLCLSLVNLVSAIFNLGLDDAMVRYVAIYRSKQQTKSLRGLLLFCTTLAGLAGLAGALLLLYFTPPLVTYWITLKQHQVVNKETLTRAIALLQVMAPVIPLMTMQVMWFAGLRGFKAFKWRVLSTNFLQPLLQILLLGLVLIFFRTKDGIAAVAVVLFISTLLNTVLNMYFLSKEVKRVATPEPVQYEVREWLTFATLNFLTTIIDTVLDSIDTILLATFGVPDAQLGQYGAAMKLSNFIQMPLLSLSNIFAPTIAELHSKGERKRLESMFKVVTKWSITFSLPLFLIMVLFSPYVLALPGPGFTSAWPLLIAFALGSMINAGTGTVGYMLLMTGYQRLSFLNSLVAVVVNIILGILLTPRYGAMGTAVSTGLAICALNLMRVLQVRIFLKMHPWRMDSLKPVGAGLISSALIGLGLYLLHRSHIQTSVKLGHAILSVQLLLIPVFLFIYTWLLILFKASPEDEVVLSAVRKKFLRGKGKKKKK